MVSSMAVHLHSWTDYLVLFLYVGWELGLRSTLHVFAIGTTQCASKQDRMSPKTNVTTFCFRGGGLPTRLLLRK